MSGAQTSTGPNVLYDPLMAGRVGLQQNALAQGQQTIDANEMEQASRAANWIISQDPENKDPDKQAQSYTAALRILRANNYALKSPDAYPGFEAMQYLARSGTPSAEQFKLGQAGTAIPTPGFGPGAAAPPAPSAPGAAPNAGGATIGQRQNNPGNLSFAGQPYASPGQGNRFASFPDMATGVAANADQLALYQTQHGINTVRGAVTRWVSDPKANLTSYIDDISKAIGVGPDDKIDLTDPVVQQKFIQAQFPHESAGGGYVLNPADVQKGVQMAAARHGQQVQPTPQVATAQPPAAPPGAATTPPPYRVAQAGPLTTPPPAAPTAPPGTDLVGPRPLPPTGAGQGPEVTPQSLANTPAPQNAQASPPPPPAQAQAQAPTPPPPAATAPPAIAPVAIPAPPAMDQNNLTRQDYADLDRARRAGMSGPQLTQEVQQRQVANLARQERYRGDVRQAQNDAQAANERAIADARAAEQLRLSQVTSQREQEAAAALAEQRRIENKRQQEAADRDAQRLAQGSTQADKDTYTLRTEDPSSQQYAEAWSRKKWEVAPNGNVIEKDVSEYPAPTRSIQRPSFVPAPTPQGLDEVRKADTDAKVITSAIDHYIDVFTATGGTNWGAYFDNPQDPKAQQLIGAYNRMKTVLRSPQYYNTGVLQPAEIKLLGQDLLEPGSIRGLFATPQALATRLGEIRLAVLTRQDAELRSIGKNGVIVRDKADFAQVPEGGRYYDEEGNLRIKPGAK